MRLAMNDAHGTVWARALGHRPNSPMSVPGPLRSYLVGLSDRVSSMLGRRLVGVYVGGSVALGDYRHGRSDVDVAVVAADAVSDGEKKALVEALRHEAFPCPARGLEFVLYRLEVARTGTAAPGYELNLNTGTRMPFRVDYVPDPIEGHWFTIDRSILAQHGVTVVGPPPDHVFAPISRDALLPLLSASLAWHARGLGRADDAVLNAARTLRVVVEGVWSSKAAAAWWARSQLPDSTVVQHALDARAGGPELAQSDAASFLAFVAERVRVELTAAIERSAADQNRSGPAR